MAQEQGSQLRMQFLDAIAAGTIPALATRLQVAALEGDLEATKLLLGYCLGKPSPAVELSGLDCERLGQDPDPRALADALKAALAPFPEEVRYAVARALWEVNEGFRDRPG